MNKESAFFEVSLDIRRKFNVEKTSSERLNYVQFTSSVRGVNNKTSEQDQASTFWFHYHKC